jgi:hypothetical protein
MEKEIECEKGHSSGASKLIHIVGAEYRGQRKQSMGSKGAVENRSGDIERALIVQAEHLEGYPGSVSEYSLGSHWE